MRLLKLAITIAWICILAALYRDAAQEARASAEYQLKVNRDTREWNRKVIGHIAWQQSEIERIKKEAGL